MPRSVATVAGLAPDRLARLFFRARTDRVAELLDTLGALGQPRSLCDGRFLRA